MKTKTIKKVLNHKISNFLLSIDDENVAEEARRNIIVTGGCIASMLLGEDVNDYDVYFKTYESALSATKYFVAKFKETNLDHKIEITDGKGNPINEAVDKRIKIKVQSAGVAGEDDSAADNFDEDGIADPANASFEGEPQPDIETKKKKYHPVYLSSNAITLSGQIQLIIRFFGNAKEIHKNFDFIHCTNYYDYENDKLVLSKDALEAILTKELRYCGSLYPVCSIIRLRKFIKRGWTINASQILKMVFQCHDLNLGDVSVLEDQLTGVDSLYFKWLISTIKEQQKDGKIQSGADIKNYACEIIDRMF